MDLFDKLFRKEGHPADDVLVATLNRNIALATTPFDPELYRQAQQNIRSVLGARNIPSELPLADLIQQMGETDDNDGTRCLRGGPAQCPCDGSPGP